MSRKWGSRAATRRLRHVVFQAPMRARRAEEPSRCRRCTSFLNLISSAFSRASDIGWPSTASGTWYSEPSIITTWKVLLVSLSPFCTSSRSMQAYVGSAAQSELSAAVARCTISLKSAPGHALPSTTQLMASRAAFFRLCDTFSHDKDAVVARFCTCKFFVICVDVSIFLYDRRARRILTYSPLISAQQYPFSLLVNSY